MYRLQIVSQPQELYVLVGISGGFWKLVGTTTRCSLQALLHIVFRFWDMVCCNWDIFQARTDGVHPLDSGIVSFENVSLLPQALRSLSTQRMVRFGVYLKYLNKV